MTRSLREPLVHFLLLGALLFGVWQLAQASFTIRHQWVVALPGYVVGTFGAFWTIQRAAPLMGALR